MHIQSIQLSNYRRFEEMHCEFDRYFTLLIGPNGSGKTSLLRAIYISLLPGLLPLDSKPVRFFETTDVRRTNTLDPGGSQWHTASYPARLVIRVGFEEQDSIYLGQLRDAGGVRMVWDDPDLGQMSEQLEFMHRQVAQWIDPTSAEPAAVVARYGASPISGVASPGAVRPPFEDKREVLRRSSGESIDAAQVAQWFQYNELRTLQEGLAPTPYRVARSAVLAAIHADDIRYVVRDNQLMLRYQDGGWQPFDQLSDGQRRVAAIFCDLALRCAALNSHLAEACLTESTGVVLIDELDLHLHPLWQRSIIGDLRRVFPKLQFIAASHSPFLLQAAYEYGKVLDVSTGQFVEPTDHSIEDIAESVMGVDQPQRSERFLELKRLSQEFYELLETKPATNDEVVQLKEKLDHAMAAFANDPAAAAWLEQRRIAAGH